MLTFAEQFYVMATKDNFPLFHLIKSLSKSEKRNFRLYVNRLASSDYAKFLQLFNALDRQQHYNEKDLLAKNPAIKKMQLANLKAHLYKQLLISLRLFYRSNDMEISIREQLDCARVLYNKGLYSQSLKVLEKAKMKAKKYHRTYLFQNIVEYEKMIESQYVNQDIKERARDLSEESERISLINRNISIFSNAAITLYGYFLQNGHVRSLEDMQKVKRLYDNLNLRQTEEQQLTTFDERLHLYMARVRYYNLVQDFPNCYRYAEKWVSLFRECSEMIEPLAGYYLKGVELLLNALFYARSFSRFSKELKALDSVPERKQLWQHENTRVLYHQILLTNHINFAFLKGEYQEGLSLVSKSQTFLSDYENMLGKHEILIFYYKLACLYFGAENYRKSIDFLNKIINEKEVNFRGDLHTFARILLAICYYEMGEYDYLESLLLRFRLWLSKAKELYHAPKLLLTLMKKLPYLSASEQEEELLKVLKQMKMLQVDRFERRAFLYLDIISWLESKIERTPICEIVCRKYQEYMCRRKIIKS